MKIDSRMNLDDLAERMGSATTESEASTLRDLLVQQFGGQDTTVIPEAQWLALLNKATNNDRESLEQWIAVGLIQDDQQGQNKANWYKRLLCAVAGHSMVAASEIIDHVFEVQNVKYSCERCRVTKVEWFSL